jgi:hypothetical protein
MREPNPTEPELILLYISCIPLTQYIRLKKVTTIIAIILSLYSVSFLVYGTSAANFTRGQFNRQNAMTVLVHLPNLHDQKRHS